MIEVLTNPDKFFEERLKREENLKTPAFIVLLSGMTSGAIAFLSSLMTVGILGGTLPPEARGFISVMLVGSAVGALVFAFIIWLVVAAILFGISALFNGEGSFKRTLEFVGYGYIPLVIGGIISAALTYHFFSTVELPTVTSPEEVADAIAALMASPMMQLSSVIGMLFLLWAANLWVFGLKHARKLSIRDALITVAIPVAVYVMYSVWKLATLSSTL